MRAPTLLLAVTVFFSCATGMAAAQSTGVVSGGSSDTLVNGKPAARIGDDTSNGGAVVEGSSNVFINGKPAAVVGGKNGCGGVVVGGSSNVFVNGKPLASAGSQTSGCSGR